MTDIRSDVSEVHPGVGDRVLEGVEEVPFVCEVVEVSDGFEELAVARLETVEEHVSKPTAGMSRDSAVTVATINRMETDAEGAVYETHVILADGSNAMVKLDANFTVTGTESGHR